MLTWFTSENEPPRERWGRRVRVIGNGDLKLITKVSTGAHIFYGCASGQYLPLEGEVLEESTEIFLHRPSGIYVVFCYPPSPYIAGGEEILYMFYTSKEVKECFRLQADWKESESLQADIQSEYDTVELNRSRYSD
jgi:hypothetical protein